MVCRTTSFTYGIDALGGLTALGIKSIPFSWGVAPGWYRARLRRLDFLSTLRICSLLGIEAPVSGFKPDALEHSEYAPGVWRGRFCFGGQSLIMEYHRWY